jgi:hypothetical protein
VIYGQFQPDGQAIKDALAVRLNQGSFDAVSAVAATQFTGAALTQLLMAKNPLFSTSFIGINVSVNATSATFGNPQITLTPQTGDLDVHVVVPNVNVTADVNAAFLSLTANITADSAVVDAQIQVNVGPGGVVTTQVVNDTVTLNNFNWNLNPIPSFLTGLATSLVQGQITSQITNMVKTTLPQQINQMLAGATGQPITYPIMGATATFTLTPTAVTFDTLGANVKTDADVSFSPVPGFTPPSAPGSFIVGGAAPQNGGPSPDFYASINQDLMNRAGHAIWKSGLAHLTIDSSPQSIVQIPSFIPLDMGLLQLFIPELAGKAPPGDSISFVVTPKLPPIFQVQAGPDALQAGMGELALEVYDTQGAQPTLVLALALQVKVSAAATVNAQNTFDIQLGPNPFVDCSLSASPLAPSVNTIGLDNFVGFVVPPVLQLVGNMWSGFPLPVYQGIQAKNITIYQDGAQGSFLTAKGDLH